MAYTPQENSGVLFKNTKKTEEKQPDYTGNIFIEGKDLRLAAWIKQGKQGNFLSIKVSEQKEKKETAQTSNDDMPF